MSPLQHGDTESQLIGVFKSLQRAVRRANKLGRADQLQIVQAYCPQVEDDYREATRAVISSISAIGSRYSVVSNSADSDATSDASSCSPRLTSGDALYDLVTNITDETLENFNSSLDAARGIRDAIVVQPGAMGPNFRLNGAPPTRRYSSCLDIDKPQLQFPDFPIDNSDATFVPPFSKQRNENDSAECELDASAVVNRHLENLFKSNANPHGGHEPLGKHPYEDEIAASTVEMSQKSFKSNDTTVYASLEDTPCTFIMSEEDLFNMAGKLQKAAEIAVDIENHSIRSFQGFICLIQISTRREDFVIDALALRGSIHRALAPIFADPTIVKVLHGADKDVQWLERDFGIYVVNMFDTGQAARLLKFPSASLAYLLTRFCSVKAVDKKKFQMADWRQRPLPDDMFAYARSDTHYLLYIFDRLRSEIETENVREQAWEKSAIVARKRHRKPRFDPSMARYLAAKHGLGFDQHQMRMLEGLCQWRDKIAREEDESLMYVAPLSTIYGVVRAKEKVRTPKGFMEFGFKSKIVPPLMAKHVNELASLMNDALDTNVEAQQQAVVEPEIGRRKRKRETTSGRDGLEQRLQMETCTPMESAENVMTKRKITSVAIIKAAQVAAKSKSSIFKAESSDDDSDGDDSSRDEKCKKVCVSMQLGEDMKIVTGS